MAAQLDPPVEVTTTRSGRGHDRRQTRLLPPQGEKRARRGSTNPSCESRPAEPGASSYPVSARNDSSIADLVYEASSSNL